MAVLIDEDHRQRVVRQHACGDFRDARKHRADVEDVGDGPEQFDRAFDFGVAGARQRPHGRLGEPLVCQPEVLNEVTDVMFQ